MSIVGLVTGGASGVGEATVEALTRAGAVVAVCDINPNGAKVAERCGGMFVELDVADSRAWADAMREVTAALGPIDVAHLNAGIMTARADEPIDSAMDLSKITDERCQRIVSINLGGVLHGLRHLWDPMTSRGHGAIVATASAAGLAGYMFDPLYSATKHGVVGLVRSVAPALSGRGVRVQALCPGGIDTPLLPDIARSIPLLSAEQVASAVADLLLVERAGTVFSISHNHPEATPVADPVVAF
jgi:NAD(P)-dependent dehydrogenase (short-subunit alcohol dehydrogenase family)